jgi:hypothetical protein
MVRMAPKHLVLSSALLLAALPALANSGNNEEARNVAPSAAAPTAIVKCPGLTSIPFTSDAEQALPLRVVGSLTCGETVAILSGGEGYTSEIRTKDGQEGYVAQMYLAAAENAPARQQKAQLSSAKPVNGIVRWSAGQPGCDEFISHGRHVESVTANGITVQVSVQDSGWKYRANVAVSNQSGERVDVLPGIVTLDELAPNMKTLYAVSPEKLEHTTTHQVLWTLVDAVPSPSAVINYSNADRLANRASEAPDYLSPHFALTSSTHHVAFERTEPVDVQSIALKTSGLPSGQITAGVMWFERDNNAHELSMRVPVGNMVFDFPFSFEQKK